MNRILPWIAALGVAASPASAQDAAPRSPGNVCFRGFDETRCHNYIVTELSFSQAMMSSTKTLYFGNDVERQADFEQKGHAALGLARNLPNRQSIGAVAVFDVSQDGNFTGIEARYRRWIGTSANAWFSGIGGTSHASYISGAAVLALMIAVFASLGPNY